MCRLSNLAATFRVLLVAVGLCLLSLTEPALANFDAFKKRMIEEIEKIENVDRVAPGRDDETLKIKLKDKADGTEGLEFYLGNAYREFSANPGGLDEIVSRYLSAITAATTPTVFARDKLVTLLRPTSYLIDDDREYVQERQAAGQPLDWMAQQNAFRLWGGDMIISIMLDGDRKFSSVPIKMLKDNQLNLDEAVTTGIANVRRITADRELQHDQGLWFVISEQQSFTSSIILDEDYWRQVAAKFPKGMIAAVPAREFILLVEKGSRPHLKELKRVAKAYYEETSHPQSAYLYAWTDNGWVATENFTD